MVRALLLVCLVGCSWYTSNIRAINGAGLATSAALLACDWGQTHSASFDGVNGYRSAPWEEGVAQYAIGQTPSPEAVTVYFAAASIVVLGTTQILPPKWRPIIYGLLIVGELSTVIGNHRVVRGFCGIGAAVRP